MGERVCVGVVDACVCAWRGCSVREFVHVCVWVGGGGDCVDECGWVNAWVSVHARLRRGCGFMCGWVGVS